MKGIIRNKKIFLVIVIILFLAFVGLGLYIYFEILNVDFIYDGIKIEEYDVSLMSQKETIDFIRLKKENFKKMNMKLVYTDEVYNISLADLGVEFNYEKAVGEAFSIGRKGNIFNKIKDIIKTKIYGVNIELDLNYNEGKIRNIVNMIVEDINVQAKDAEFHFNDGEIEIVNEIVGKVVDKEKLYKMIRENIHKLDVIEIPVNNIIPKVSKDLLSRINGVIGAFSTSFNGSSLNRIENIRLSANSFKGKMLMPEESMSFNETTGPRKKDLGYREASVIINGEYTSDIGGGVCQTSTTLYNALLLADITILERFHHSIPPNYVDKGKDATVSYGALDLKFRNDFNYPIYFDSKIVGDRLYFYIYGDAESRDYTVNIKSEIVEKIYPEEENEVDESLEPGGKVLVQKGRVGYKANTYKYIIKDGQVVSKELITQDYYKPRNYIYRVGRN